MTDDPKTEHQVKSMVCQILIDVDAKRGIECKPFINYYYGTGPGSEKEPDCSTCEVAKEYGYIEAPEKEEEE